MRRIIPGRFIGYKKSENKRYVFFVEPAKIKRIILTLLGQMAVLLRDDPTMATDRADSHCEENFIGTIRDLCNGDNQWSTITHNLARHEYIIRYLENQFIKPKRKRLNVGGVPIKIEGFDTEFFYGPKTISENLFELISNNFVDQNMISHFLSKLELISQNCLYKKVHVPAITSNGDILNRLISLGIKTTKNKKRTFSEGETIFIDRFLLNKIEHDDQFLSQLFQCSLNEIMEFKEFRTNVLSKREWSR